MAACILNELQSGLTVSSDLVPPEKWSGHRFSLISTAIISLFQKGKTKSRKQKLSPHPVLPFGVVYPVPCSSLRTRPFVLSGWTLDSSLWAAMLGPIPTLFSPTVLCASHRSQEGSWRVQNEVCPHRRGPPDLAQRLPCL